MFNDFFQTAMLISLLSMMFRIATPVLLAALGELVAERSGVMNLGIEGIMLTGAFVAFLILDKTDSFLISVISAILAGGLMGMLMSFLTVSLKLNQTVVGLGLNLLASGLTFYLYRIAYTVTGTFEIPRIGIFPIIPIPLLSDIPFIGPVLFNQMC